MKSLSLAVLLASLASAAPARAASPPFECPVPSGWTSAEDGSSMRMTGPADANRIPSLIMIRYYGPDDRNFSSAEAYMKRQTVPLFKVPGDKTGTASKIMVAGRKAARIVNTSAVSIPPNSMRSKEVPTRAEHVVVPAERGFYVLLNDSPASLAAANRAAFKAVLAGFKPKL
jgi:hypothetical protein